MRLNIPLGILLLASALPVSSAPLVFDAASIRKSVPTGGRGDHADMLRDAPQLSPVSFTMRNVTLKTCIHWAWDVMESQVSGPAWLGTDRFDILGKAASPATEAEFRQMLQALLTERFQLEFHRQTKEQSVYILATMKTGPKFKESAADGDIKIEPDTAHMSIGVKRARVSTLASLLSKILFMPVVDQTGLNGYYDLTLNFGKYMPQAGDGIPDIVGILNSGLQEELGLRLETKKVSLDFIIVDRAEKVPSEN